jgi:hypothetical protein
MFELPVLAAAIIPLVSAAVMMLCDPYCTAARAAPFNSISVLNTRAKIDTREQQTHQNRHSYRKFSSALTASEGTGVKILGVRPRDKLLLIKRARLDRRATAQR